MNIAPTVTCQISEHLSVGVTLNVYYGDADLKRNVFFAPAPLPEGRFEFNGDGEGLGATLGLLWKITDQHAIAMAQAAFVRERLRAGMGNEKDLFGRGMNGRGIDWHYSCP